MTPRMEPDHSTLTCRCRVTFRGNARFDGKVRRMVADRDCPGCGKRDEIQRVQGDPESWTLGRG
jgi:hypothetical protein